MKKIVLLSTAFLFSLAIMAQKPDDVIKVTEESYDFGKLKHNVPATHYFEIKNISDKQIVVENSWASCGCTTPEKIVQPIMPGESAKLKVVYSSNAVAPFTKEVFVKLAGIEQPKTLKITGEVLSAEAYDAWLKSKNGN
jgi:hypothetical protein